MSEVNRRYFEGLMQDRKLSLRQLAAQMGMGHSQLSLTFTGARRMQLDEAAQIASIFSRPLHEVVVNAGVAVASMTAGTRVSVIGAVQGDGTVALYGEDIVERTTAPEGLPDDAVAIQFRTGGSPLDWADTWVSFCRPHNGIDPALLGRICLLKLREGPAAVATVKRGYRESTYNLSGFYNKESAHLEWATPLLITRH